MFLRDGILYRSTILADEPGIVHGFSTRDGGISSLAHTASMNVARGHGDSDETVRENIGICFLAQICGNHCIVLCSVIEYLVSKLKLLFNGNTTVLKLFYNNVIV